MVKLRERVIEGFLGLNAISIIVILLAIFAFIGFIGIKFSFHQKSASQNFSLRPSGTL